MPPSPARVPVCLVTGATGAGKSTLIRALAIARPSTERWAVLNNDGGEFSPLQSDTSLTVATAIGCACCTGQVMLQTAIVRLIRQTRPARLIIEAAATAEPAALKRALLQEHLARATQITLHLCVANAAQWAAYPPAARALMLAQMQAADHVVARDHAAAAKMQKALADSGIAAEKIVQIEGAIRLALAGPAPASSANAQRISS